MKPAPSATSNILLVDDNRDGLLVRRSLLEEVGYRVQIATNGEEGLKLFESSAFDVVVTDYRMPRMDGGEFIQRIRQLKPDARIILLSGFVDPLGLTEAAHRRGRGDRQKLPRAGAPAELGEAAAQPRHSAETARTPRLPGSAKKSGGANKSGTW